MRSLVLLSGGIDSAACLSFYKGLAGRTEAVFVDYGQPTDDAERASAEAIAAHYSTPLNVVTCRGPLLDFKGEIYGRNAFLILVALLFNPALHGTIALGIHYGTKYYDCQDAFVNDITRLLDGYSDGRVKLGVPFLFWSKEMVWRYSLERGVPLGLTWSCEVGPDKPCGACLSCRDVEALRVRTQ